MVSSRRQGAQSPRAGVSIMLVYFMRHGEAEESAGGQGDSARRLTEKGRRRTRDSAQTLRKLAVTVPMIITSPLVRARQTADIVGEVLGAPVIEDSGLAGCNLEQLAEVLEAHKVSGTVMVVGHEPDFSAMVGELIGRGHVEMKKGAVACVSVQGLARGGGVLVWLMSGKDLAALG
jgi:phosphohistidine phosphatase